MKQINFIGVGLLSLALGCGQPENKTVEKQKDLVITATKSPKPAEDQLVIPGNKVGQLSLGQDMNAVFKALGKPDDGDAAMGKAWSIWHVTPKDQSNSGEIAIYSTYKDSTMASKVAVQIMVNTDNYATANGLRNNVDLKTISDRLKSLKHVATYIDEKEKDTLYVYDAEPDGIAFDMKKKDHQLFSEAMTIHPKGESVNNTYLTIHPGWKKVQ